ncbi:MAG: threonylcarbamoyl-AMP synthase [Rhodobacteraceae bacterium]|nr:threonylcarbamoyl-AMP synthase [Paracoccaceae bacterium]
MAATVVLPPDAAGLARAAALLARGELVAFPTETVYGLGADARSGLAVAALFAAKGRPHFNPLIIHVADLAAARALAAFPPAALRLAAAFWPGPLTLVLPLAPGAGLAGLATAGLATVALRVPAHPLAQGLIAAFGGPLAAPSANPSGRISPTRAGHVTAGLGGRIAAVIDGGACAVGVESTILAVAADRVVLLRPGGLPAEAVAAVLGRPPEAGGGGGVPAGVRPQAPGQLASHYAPAARLRLEAAGPGAGEVWLGFGPGPGGLNLSPAGDLAEAAANLFHLLHAADAAAGPEGRIAVAPVPERGLGRAINDRLRRAAAPRP